MQQSLFSKDLHPTGKVERFHSSEKQDSLIIRGRREDKSASQQAGDKQRPQMEYLGTFRVGAHTLSPQNLVTRQFTHLMTSALVRECLEDPFQIF